MKQRMGERKREKEGAERKKINVNVKITTRIRTIRELAPMLC